MNKLVTGATGFVGSAVVRRLLARGEAVSVLARENSDRSNLTGLDVEVRVGDLRDAQSLRNACRNCDGLYHVAADYRLWTRDSRELYTSNVEGTRHLMRAALDAGVERIVYTSSVATLGNIGDGTPGTEETPVTVDDMVGHYKRSKFLAERVVDEFVTNEQLPAVIVNPSTPIGPRDIKPTPTGRVIRDAAAGKIPAYVDTGLNIAHVDDVAHGHLLAFDKGEIGRRYILGGEDMSLRDILFEIARHCGRQPPRINLPRHLIFPVAYVSQAWAWLTYGDEPQVTVDGLKMAKKKMFFASTRAQGELDYVARPAIEALHDAIEWFRANSP